MSTDFGKMLRGRNPFQNGKAWRQLDWIGFALRREPAGIPARRKRQSARAGSRWMLMGGLTPEKRRRAAALHKRHVVTIDRGKNSVEIEERICKRGTQDRSG